MNRNNILKIILGCCILIGILGFYYYQDYQNSTYTETLYFYKYSISNAKDQEIVILDCNESNVIKFTSYVIDNPYNYSEYFEDIESLHNGKITKEWLKPFKEEQDAINKILYPIKKSKFDKDNISIEYIKNVDTYCIVNEYSCYINKETLKFLCTGSDEMDSVNYDWIPKNAALVKAVSEKKDVLDKEKTIDVLTDYSNIYVGSNGFKQISKEKLSKIINN